MIIPAIIALLLAEPTISALVNQSVYAGQLPTASPMPAIVLSGVGGQSKPTLTGPGLQKVRIQIDCFGASYLSADLVRDALIKFLNMKSATLGSGVWLQGAMLIQPLDFPYDWQTLQFRLGAEFYLFFNFPAS
jgi:Protein of unknown function (DUF3168)